MTNELQKITGDNITSFNWTQSEFLSVEKEIELIDSAAELNLFADQAPLVDITDDNPEIPKAPINKKPAFSTSTIAGRVVSGIDSFLTVPNGAEWAVISAVTQTAGVSGPFAVCSISGVQIAATENYAQTLQAAQDSFKIARFIANGSKVLQRVTPGQQLHFETETGAEITAQVSFLSGEVLEKITVGV